MALLSRIVWQVPRFPRCPPLGKWVPGEAALPTAPLTSASSRWLVAGRPTSPPSARRGPGVRADAPCRPRAAIGSLSKWAGQGAGRLRSPAAARGRAAGTGLRTMTALKTQQPSSPKTRGLWRWTTALTHTRVHTHHTCMPVCIGSEPQPGAHHSVDHLHTTVWTL